MEKFTKIDLDKFCKDAARELAARLLGKVIRRTPVDTG
ncbi:HK97 gp10 family phage protein, partial [Clostridioides difficile]|nr:HK97 gp10 family phage protein [Clostridioides difficile]